MKQNGALLAKGRLLGIQFEVLFVDHLYLDISKYAHTLAMEIREAFTKKGFTLHYDSVTNQQFIILPNTLLKQLQMQFAFMFWEKYSETEIVVCICISWATKREHVE